MHLIVVSMHGYHLGIWILVLFASLMIQVDLSGCINFGRFFLSEFGISCLHTCVICRRISWVSDAVFCCRLRGNLSGMAFLSSLQSVNLLDSNSCKLQNGRNRNFGVIHFKGWSFVRMGSRVGKSSSCTVRVVNLSNEYDFSDPDWKDRFKVDFESRFSLPHLRDVLDVKPRPTSFSLTTRYLSFVIVAG